MTFMKKLFYPFTFLILCLLFSMHGFAQVDSTKQTDTTKQKSLSPLLDKYYNRPKEDTVVKKPVIKSTGVQQRTVKTPAPVKHEVIDEKRLSFPTPTRPAFATSPSAPDSVVTAVAETPVKSTVITERAITPPISTNTIIADTKISMPISDTSRINRSAIATTTAIPPKKPASKPEGSLLRTRLGSSSPLYNTYEKNKNGAGSVTTLPKR